MSGRRKAVSRITSVPGDVAGDALQGLDGVEEPATDGDGEEEFDVEVKVEVTGRAGHGVHGDADGAPDISPAGVTPEVLAALTEDDDVDLVRG